MARKAESLPTLAAHGLIAVGQVLEIIPGLLPAGAERNDPRFRATIVATSGRQGSIRWHSDGHLYSLTGLTRILWENHGVQWPGKTCLNWHREGQRLTLWDEAEQFIR